MLMQLTVIKLTSNVLLDIYDLSDKILFRGYQQNQDGILNHHLKQKVLRFYIKWGKELEKTRSTTCQPFSTTDSTLARKKAKHTKNSTIPTEVKCTYHIFEQ